MANPQHVEWLKKGVAAWNRRRQEKPFTPDLSGLDLSNAGREFPALWDARSLRASLRGANLKEADLRNAELLKATLQEADLRRAELRGADLEAANLRGTDLRGADIEAANLRGASLVGANLRNAKLRGANLQGAVLRNAELEAANLKATIVRSVWAAGADKQLRPPALHTDLRGRGLTQGQLDEMHGDAHTTISEHLTRPAHWLEDGEVEQEASSDEEVADTPQDQEHEALPPWVAQLPNAIALSWEPSQNGGVQIVLRPPTDTPRPADPVARAAQLRIVAQLARQLANSVLSYQDDAKGNASALAKSVEAPLRAIGEEASQSPDVASVGYIRANVRVLLSLQNQQAEAFADVDVATFGALIAEYLKLKNLDPLLPRIDAPRKQRDVPDPAAMQARDLRQQILNLLDSEPGTAMIEPKAREAIRLEVTAPALPDLDGLEGRKEEVERMIAFGRELKRAAEDAPRPVRRIALYGGFAAAVKMIWEFISAMF